MTSLIDFAITDRQREVIKLVEAKSQTAAAKELGLSTGTVSEMVKRVRRYAASKCWQPDRDAETPLVDGMFLKGLTTYYKIDEDGNRQARGQHVIQRADTNQLVEFSRQLAENISSTVKPIKPRKAPVHKLCKDRTAVYPIGDAHIGLYCWGEDAQEDWDCDKAENVLLSAHQTVFDCTPSTQTALIVNLGDWFHTDSAENRTNKSGHHLDVDTRWSRVLKLGVRMMRTLIDSALLKHETVRVINEVGNHDERSSIMLSVCLAGAYENEPRVTIDTSPDEFHWHQFGLNLFGVNHGHKCKPERLYKVMAEYKGGVPWGECPHRYWFTGHIHHENKLDVGSVSCQSFRTVIPRDTYAHSNGYIAPRAAQSKVFHKTQGAKGGYIELITPEMVTSC